MKPKQFYKKKNSQKIHKNSNMWKHASVQWIQYNFGAVDILLASLEY